MLKELCEVASSGVFDFATAEPPSKADVAKVEVDPKTKKCKFSYLDPDEEHFDQCMEAVLQQNPEFKKDRAQTISRRRVPSQAACTNGGSAASDCLLHGGSGGGSGSSKLSRLTAALKDAKAEVPKASTGHFTAPGPDETSTDDAGSQGSEAGYGQVQQFTGKAAKKGSTSSVVHEKADLYKYVHIKFDKSGKMQLTDVVDSEEA